MMMDSPTSRITEAQMESPNKAWVEAELRELQDKHRLAIHVTEEYEDTDTAVEGKELEDIKYTCGTLTTLNLLKIVDKVSPDEWEVQLNTLLQKEGRALPLLSMSVLPDTHSKASITPYDSYHEKLGMPGYLFSLDEFEAQPARIASGSYDNMNTGSDPYHKPVSKKMLAPDWQTNTEKLLAEIHTEYHNFPDVRHALNELCVAAGTRHMRAIVISLRYDHKAIAPDFLKAAQLYGALQGLVHTKMGIDVPVVFYHVDDERRGQIDYLAHGRSELLARALEIVDEMAASSHLRSYIAEVDNYHQVARAMKTELGLDLTKPMAAQSKAIRKLRSELVSLGNDSVVRR